MASGNTFSSVWQVVCFFKKFNSFLMDYKLVHFLCVSGVNELQDFVKFRVSFFPGSLSVLFLPSAKHDEIGIIRNKNVGKR